MKRRGHRRKISFITNRSIITIMMINIFMDNFNNEQEKENNRGDNEYDSVIYLFQL